jgi:hypothetical protein
VLVAPAPAAADATAEWDLVALANRARHQAGLPAFNVLPELRDIAQRHAERMAREDSVNHNPNLRAEVSAVLPDWEVYGENVGRASTVHAAHEAFFGSDAHRRHLLGGFRYVGMGVVASGGRVWVSQVFVHARPGRPADTRFPVLRVNGGASVQTAVAVSQHSFPPGASQGVVVARSEDFADALAGGPLAGMLDGPVLLSPPWGVPEDVVAEARRVLAPDGTVYLLGGPRALAPAVEADFAAAGLGVVRVAGADRYETATEVARRVAARPPRLLVASGVSFPDAAAAGAAGAAHGMPILLVDTDRLPDSTVGYLADAPDVPRTVIGGTAVVSDRVMAAVGAADRVWGRTRYETAVRVAERWFPGSARLAVADGNSYQEPLVASPLAARAEAPVLLVDPSVSEEVYQNVRARISRWEEAVVVGGVAEHVLRVLLD